MKTPNLKPCPMCSGKSYQHSVLGRTGVYISCRRKSCRLAGDIYARSLKAVAAWNTRPLEDEMYAALKLAQPVLDEHLQSLCSSFCRPCEPGEKFDYAGLAEPELGWITKTEAALDAVDAALAKGKL
jgi:hypothetical protein